jgi:hypothetical protein
MQHKSPVQSTYGPRLKALRAKLQLKWVDLAKRLEVSPSMCFKVCSGRKVLGELAVYRLEQEEIKAGIASEKQPADLPQHPIVREESEVQYGAHRSTKKLKISDLERTIALMQIALNELKATVAAMKGGGE